MKTTAVIVKSTKSMLQPRLQIISLNVTGTGNVTKLITMATTLETQSILGYFIKKTKNKFCGFWSTSELYRLIDRHWLVNFSANFCG
jgi:hypothetical protein